MAGALTSHEGRYRAMAAMAREGRWDGLMTPRDDLATSATEYVLRLPAGDHPEGVAVDAAGTVFLSNRRFAGSVRQSEILRLEAEGRARVLTRLADTVNPQGHGVLGLATDPEGNIYAALDSRDPASRGVWRIASDGSSVERLEGSEGMLFPNALTFDATGNLYVTDSQTGAIWRFPAGAGRPGVWASHELLAPCSFDPFALPLPNGGWHVLELPGANGIAFHPPNHLYVANTEKGLIVEVTIGADGAVGSVRVVAGEPVPDDPGEWLPDPRLWTMDGIAVDSAGHVHAVVPGFAVLEKLTGARLSPLVRVIPGTGEVYLTPAVVEALHAPLSLAFGRTGQDRQSVYVTNSALFAELFPGPGPGLIRATVGVSGP